MKESPMQPDGGSLGREHAHANWIDDGAVVKPKSRNIASKRRDTELIKMSV